MFALRRNQVIITALVVMIAVAGYLNYSDSKKLKNDEGIAIGDSGDISPLIAGDGETATTVFGGEIGEALTVDDNPYIAASNEYSVLPAGSETMSEPGEAVFVSTSVDLPFFVQAKLEREQTVSKQREILLEMINNNNIDQEKRAECADSMLEIQNRIGKEAAAEAMIEAKGFKEAYVRIDDDTVDVVIGKEALTDAEIAQIEDIVKRKTGMESSKIRISIMKK